MSRCCGIALALAFASAALLPSETRSPHWPAVRAEYLRGHPRCDVCGKNQDLNVHHVIPFHKDAALELDQSNLITLCRHDHFLVGHGRSWRAWNPKVRQDEATIRAILDRIRREREE